MARRKAEEFPLPEEPPIVGLKDALISVEEEQTEMDKVIQIILDPKNISHLTELTRNEITAFSVLSTLRKRHDFLNVLDNFLAENMILRVSKSRAGRKELTKIVSRQLQMAEDQTQFQERGFGRFFRRR